MASKDARTVLKYLLGFQIAILLTQLNSKDGTQNHIRERSTGVQECPGLINGPRDHFNCYKDGTLENGQKGGQLNRTCGKHNEGCQYGLGSSKPILDDRVPQVIEDLQRKAQALFVWDMPEFVAQLSTATAQHHEEITESAATVQTMVKILVHIAEISQNITFRKPEMENILQTVDILVSKKSRRTWEKLNNSKMTVNTSISLLGAVEDICSRLTHDSFVINKTSIELINTVIENSYSGKSHLPNSTTEILIQQVLKPTSLTIIILTTLHSILPARYTANGKGKPDVRINGDVVVVKVNQTLQNISFVFDTTEQSLGNPQCVFWNFHLSTWDSTGCEVKPNLSEEEKIDKITCECNHTTSFSLLMSPFFIDDKALDYITYTGLGISVLSLVISLIIGAIVWTTVTKSNSAYLRHVCLVNTNVSLLVADVCFIIGASIVQPGQLAPVGPCTAVAFSMHLFFLAFFFWMLISAMLLLYMTTMVYSQMSRAKMMAIAFFLGYGAPLLIVVITYGLTAREGKYILEADVCWLNFDETKALQIFVSLASSFTAVNVLIIIVVLYKMLIVRKQQNKETNILPTVTRVVLIVSPLFGVTWGLGIGTMLSPDYGIHLVFTILNSLQGIFNLVSGLLVNSQVRNALAERWSLRNFTSSNRTRTIQNEQVLFRPPSRNMDDVSGDLSAAAPSNLPNNMNALE
uniref:Adhesion G protein-coupled receptor F11 n=1 Tax=Danio rerio TaxID=7955 RepID=E7FF72_DANRE|nr:adhesion G protein-coupled receptor F5-like isoform X1 [Danio rerio]|eukprot:XP_005160858.1 adhesion G protein-coupled receptor F5-like isoform X1 [Danio rerio]